MNSYNTAPEKPSMTLQMLYKKETGRDLTVGDNQCYATLNKEAHRFSSTQFNKLSNCDDALVDKLEIHDLIEFCK